jgi:predicted metalloendopeptidase
MLGCKAMHLERTAMIVCVAFAACGGTVPPSVTAPPAANGNAPTAARPAPEVQNVALSDVGLDASKIDTHADPCGDFYRFACGAWLDRTKIPPDKPQYGTFNEIHDRNEAILHGILEHAAEAPGTDPVLEKLGAYYGACMDEPAIEKTDTSALAPLMAATRNVKDDSTLLSAIARLQRAGVDALFAIAPAQDKKHPAAAVLRCEGE